jgi:dTDP-4-dehydrorhamnose reductase
MKRKILLTGKNGQVGRELSALLPRLADVTALDRQELDLANPDQIRQMVRSLRPEIIVNAAAYTAVDLAESNEEAAQAINAIAPGVLAEEAQKLGALLVHYSTDYVFDGTKRTPYLEEDMPNPQNAYGRTKLAGERAVQQSGASHFIFRTAWVYGREGKNFLLTILRLASQREELKIVQDQIGAPTWSRGIATATSNVLSQVCEREGKGAAFAREKSGVYHLTAAGETSWYDFTKEILQEAWGSSSQAQWVTAVTQQRPLIARRVIPIETVEYPTPARRPPYSVLSNARLADCFGVALPDWKTQLHSVFQGDL